MENLENKSRIAVLQQHIENLTKLVDINGIINSTLDIAKLLSIIMEIIKDIMNTEASTLLLYEEKTDDLVFKVATGEAGDELNEKYRVRTGQGIAGWVAEHRQTLKVDDVYSDRRFDPDFDRQTGFVTRTILCTPLLYKGRLLGVIQAINPIDKKSFDNNDINLFQFFANQAALAVQNAIFFLELVDGARLSAELKRAVEIQNRIPLPSEERSGGAVISADSSKARDLSGEFCEVRRLSGESTALFLCDTHESGTGGALNSFLIRGAVEALIPSCGKNPALLMNRLNRVLIDRLKSIGNASFLYGIFNSADNSFTYVCSGVIYPVLVRGGISRYIRRGHKSLGNEFEGNTSVNVKLRTGDSFLILSDGIINMRNEKGSKMGLKHIMSFIEKKAVSPRELIDSLFAEAYAFTGEKGKKEDMSMIIISAGKSINHE